MNKCFIIEDYGMAVELGEECKCIICYDYRDFEIIYSSEGILKKIAASIGEMIEEQYHIKLEDYGVAVYDEHYTQK